MTKMINVKKFASLSEIKYSLSKGEIKPQGDITKSFAKQKVQAKRIRTA